MQNDITKRITPILTALANAGKNAGIISIDGRAASGKSTLAAELKTAIGAESIHMDDFFLPPEMRTAERLQTPGGNVFHERFIEEVLNPLKQYRAASFKSGLPPAEGSISYRVFDCKKMEYSGTCLIDLSAPYIVIEGSYSHHPLFGGYMNLRVFSHIDPDEQIQRVKNRSGEAAAEMFAAKWIPMEEKYFSAFDIAQNADIIL